MYVQVFLLLVAVTVILPFNVTANETDELGCPVSPMTSRTQEKNNRLDDVSVTCGLDQVSISIPACGLTKAGVSPNHLYVSPEDQDPTSVADECKSTVVQSPNGGYVSQINMDNAYNCGAVSAISPRFIRTTYNLQANLKSGCGVLTASFQCVFDRSSQRNGNRNIAPTQKNIKLFLKPSRENKKYKVSTSFYTDGTFQTKLQNPTVNNGDPIYAEARLDSTNTDLTLKGNTCYASACKDGGKCPEQYLFLNQGCPVDGVSYNATNTRGRFGIKSFEFLYGRNGLTYLHCEWTVCNKKYHPCKSSECETKREKREVQTVDQPGCEMLVTFKPIRVIPTCDKPDTCGQLCNVVGDNVVCSCNEGYKLDDDGKSCVQL
nr:alpha-tectorin-like [Ciona intestinalis]|eukprot:XP_018671660.1 alpha-tectorin-like [Ciona intestinalis]